MRFRALFAALVLALVSGPAIAQAVLQGGPWSPGHAPQYVGQASGQAIIMDGGSSAGGTVGNNLSEIGISSIDPTATYPSASSGNGPDKEHFCHYDAPTNNATGYHYLCLDANAAGGGLISYGAGGGAAKLPFTFLVNGASWPPSPGPGYSVKDYGASADGKIVGVTATIGSGSSALAVASPLFTAGDVGKVIGVSGAGVTQTYGSITSVPLTTNGSYTFPPSITLAGTGGIYASAIGVWNVTAASVASAGAGCTNGTQTLTILAGGGTPAQLSVTVSGNVVASVNSVSVAGAFELYDLLNAAPASGGGCTTNPTFALTATMASVFINNGGRGYPTSGTTATITGGTFTTASVAGTPVVAPSISTLGATITAITDSTHVTLSTAASTALSGATAQITYGHDDAPAFHNCQATGNCLVPPGTYLVGSAAMTSGGVLIGSDAIGYSGYVAGNPGGSQTLTPTPVNIIVSPLANNAFYTSGAKDIRIEGVFIDCVDSNRDGVSAGSNRMVLERVTVVRCNNGLGSSYAGAPDTYSHSMTAIYSQFANNVFGVSNMIDSNMIGGALSANYTGAHFSAGSNGVTFTNVRVEWNYAHGMYLYQSQLIVVTGGLFDRNYGCGLSLSGTTNVTVNGTQFNRSGRNNDYTPLLNAHWCLAGTVNTIINAGSTAAGVDDGGAGPYTPLYDGYYDFSSVPVGTAISGSLSGGYTLAFSKNQPTSAFTASGIGLPTTTNVIWVPYSASPYTYVPSLAMQKVDVFLGAGGGGGGGGALQAASTVVSGGGGGGGGGWQPGTFTAAQVGASQIVTIGGGGTLGSAATTSNTAGGNGGAGGNTTFGSLLGAYGGGGGAGGQLAAGSGGGGGGGQTSAGSSSTNSSGGTGGSIGGGAGGTSTLGGAVSGIGQGGGGGGSTAVGAASYGGGSTQGGSGGGSGAGITSGNTTANGGSSGNAGVPNTGVLGGAGNGGNGISPSTSFRDFWHFVGSGGGGGASSTTAAFAGGNGGSPGGGGGGGGSAQNGGSAGAGGSGGNGYAIIIEYF